MKAAFITHTVPLDVIAVGSITTAPTSTTPSASSPKAGGW